MVSHRWSCSICRSRSLNEVIASAAEPGMDGVEEESGKERREREGRTQAEKSGACEDEDCTPQAAASRVQMRSHHMADVIREHGKR
jgi:hypothetical protein